MPMIPFVPDTLILSGEVNQNFDNTVALDTSRTVVVSHTWNARQNLLGGILTPNGSATQPSLALRLGGTPVGFYHTGSDLIRVAGRLDLPGLVINAGSGIVVAGGTHTSKTISANLSGQSGNQLSFDGTGGLFVAPSASQLTAGNGIQIAGDSVSARISSDADNTLVFGSDDGLFVPPGASELDAGDGIAISGDTISASLSGDANNALSFGSDDGLFAPIVTPTTVSAGTGINVTGPAANRTVAAHLSTDQDNAIRLGADDGLYAPLGPIKIVGSVATAADLPDPYTGDEGDSYITNDDGHIHVWDGAAWVDAGEIRGPPGPATTITAGNGINVTGTNPNYTVASKLSDDAANALSFGSDDGLFAPPGSEFLQVHQENADYTFVPADAGQKIRRAPAASGDATWTIPSPDPFDQGTLIYGVNASPGTVTLTNPNGVQRLRLLTSAGSVTGDISIPQGGWVRLHKITANVWEATSNFSWDIGKRVAVDFSPGGALGPEDSGSLLRSASSFALTLPASLPTGFNVEMSIWGTGNEITVTPDGSLTFRLHDGSGGGSSSSSTDGFSVNDGGSAKVVKTGSFVQITGFGVTLINAFAP